jgi:Na+/H+-dicarboxylate symporter
MSDVFLRLIKMLIGPLVFSTLVVGIAHMGDAANRWAACSARRSAGSSPPR